MKISDSAEQALMAEEGTRLYAYPDPASKLHKAFPKARWGFVPAAVVMKSLPQDNAHVINAVTSGAPWTVGIGFTGQLMNGDIIGPDTAMTPFTIEKNFDWFIVGREEVLTDYVAGVPTTQNEFDAMFSLMYNIGNAAFGKSTVLKRHRAGDKSAAARAFHLFNKAQGKVNDGLVARRAREAAGYLVLEVFPDQIVPIAVDLPSTPDAESSPVASPINLGAGVTASAAIGLVAENLKTGTPILYVLAAAMVIAAGVIIYQRYKQRKGGWA